jgi:hypothetical protein
VLVASLVAEKSVKIGAEVIVHAACAVAMMLPSAQRLLPGDLSAPIAIVILASPGPARPAGIWGRAAKLGKARGNVSPSWFPGSM